MTNKILEKHVLVNSDEFTQPLQIDKKERNDVMKIIFRTP
jgi:hypothetical protein